MARRTCFAAIGILLLAISRAWAEPQAPPPDFPKFEPKPCEVTGEAQKVPAKVAYVVPGAGSVTAIAMAKTSKPPERGHYVVTEWSGGVKSAEGVITGILPVAEASGVVGPNTSCQATAYSGSVGSSYSVASIGPLKVINPITVEWDRGEKQEPEPAEGLVLRFFHDCQAYTETQGAGVGKIVGSAKARATAQTRGPSQSCRVESESQAPLVGADADPRGNSLVETLRGLHSGWKGYLVAQVSGVAGSWLIGCARSEATAEITWEAESPAAVENDLQKPGRERSIR